MSVELFSSYIVITFMQRLQAQYNITPLSPTAKSLTEPQNHRITEW